MEKPFIPDRWKRHADGKLFPAFTWRIKTLRLLGSKRQADTSDALTVDDDDPREHYFDRLGGECIHCGKSAREIARIDEVNGDDEFLNELESRRESNALQEFA